MQQQNQNSAFLKPLNKHYHKINNNQTGNVGEGAEKGEHLRTVGGHCKYRSHCENRMEIPKTV